MAEKGARLLLTYPLLHGATHTQGVCSKNMLVNIFLFLGLLVLLSQAHGVLTLDVRHVTGPAISMATQLGMARLFPQRRVVVQHTPQPLTGVGSRWATPAKARQVMQAAARAFSSDKAAASEGYSGLADPADQSELVDRDIMLFLMKLSLDIRLNKAVILEDEVAAPVIRKQMEQVTAAMAALDAKKPIGGPPPEFTDAAADGLLARAELQRAVEEERYADAAKLRDRIKAAEEKTQPSANFVPVMRFNLGQTVRHAVYGYYGIVAGADEVCREGEEWLNKTTAAATPRGRDQPYYILLPDKEAWANFTASGGMEAYLAYVPEDNLRAVAPPPEPDGQQAKDDGGATEPEPEPAPKVLPRHPFTYTLFYGADHVGNHRPISKLKERFSVAVAPPS